MAIEGFLVGWEKFVTWTSLAISVIGLVVMGFGCVVTQGGTRFVCVAFVAALVFRIRSNWKAVRRLQQAQPG